MQGHNKKATGYETKLEGLSSVSLRLTAPSAEGAFGGAASADAGFRLCGGEAVDGARLAAFRSPPPPLRAAHF